jgi:hypothetical protein
MELSKNQKIYLGVSLETLLFLILVFSPNITMMLIKIFSYSVTILFIIVPGLILIAIFMAAIKFPKYAINFSSSKLKERSERKIKEKEMARPKTLICSKCGKEKQVRLDYPYNVCIDCHLKDYFDSIRPTWTCEYCGIKFVDGWVRKRVCENCLKDPRRTPGKPHNGDCNCSDCWKWLTTKPVSYSTSAPPPMIASQLGRGNYGDSG